MKRAILLLFTFIVFLLLAASIAAKPDKNCIGKQCQRFARYLPVTSATPSSLPVISELYNCQTINASGHYRVANDIFNWTSTNCFSVISPHVSVNCEGHRIISYRDAYTAFSILANNVTIQNCHLAHYGHGVKAGTRYQRSINLLNNFFNNSDVFIYGARDVFVGNNTFLSANITFNDSSVVSVWQNTFLNSSRIDLITVGSVSVRNNSIINGSATLYNVSDLIFSYNRLEQGQGLSIVRTRRGTIEHNRMAHNNNYGLYLGNSSENHFTQNYICDNLLYELPQYPGFFKHKNVFCSNSSFGIFIDNAYRDAAVPPDGDCQFPTPTLQVCDPL